MLTLISWLLDGVGVDNKGYSQFTLTCSQLIMSNFKTQGKKSAKMLIKGMLKKGDINQDITALKLNAAIKSTTLIDTFFNMGILEFTKSVSDSSVHQYSMDGVLLHSNLNKGIFTLVAKDNIDQNTRSTTAGRHYHETSMTVMQYPAKDNPGQVQTFPILETNATKGNSNADIPPIYFPRQKKAIYAPHVQWKQTSTR